MRKRFAVLAFVLALLVAGAFSRASIAASMHERVEIGQWAVEAFTGEATADFNNCTMEALYPTGISLYFSVDRSFDWQMALRNDAWALEQGAEYQISYSTDSTAPIEAIARAVSSHTVLIDLDRSHGQFDRFRKAEKLTVAAASQTFEFGLHAAEALDATFSCAERHAKTLPPASNPFTSSTNLEQLRDLVMEGTVVAANLLAHSGLQEFRIGERSEIPTFGSRIYDAIWVTPDVNGGIKIFVGSEATDEISSAAIAREKRICKGSLSSGKISDRNPLVVRFFSVCAGADGATTYFSIVPRRAGGSFVLSVWSHTEAGAAAKAADEKIRAAVAKVMDR